MPLPGSTSRTNSGSPNLCGEGERNALQVLSLQARRISRKARRQKMVPAVTGKVRVHLTMSFKWSSKSTRRVCLPSPAYVFRIPSMPGSERRTALRDGGGSGALRREKRGRAWRRSPLEASQVAGARIARARTSLQLASRPLLFPFRTPAGEGNGGCERRKRRRGEAQQRLTKHPPRRAPGQQVAAYRSQSAQCSRCPPARRRRRGGSVRRTTCELAAAAAQLLSQKLALGMRTRRTHAPGQYDCILSAIFFATAPSSLSSRRSLA